MLQMPDQPLLTVVDTPEVGVHLFFQQVCEEVIILRSSRCARGRMSVRVSFCVRASLWTRGRWGAIHDTGSTKAQDKHL